MGIGNSGNLLLRNLDKVCIVVSAEERTNVSSRGLRRIGALHQEYVRRSQVVNVHKLHLPQHLALLAIACHII